MRDRQRRRVSGGTKARTRTMRSARPPRASVLRAVNVWKGEDDDDGGTSRELAEHCCKRTYLSALCVRPPRDDISRGRKLERDRVAATTGYILSAAGRVCKVASLFCEMRRLVGVLLRPGMVYVGFWLIGENFRWVSSGAQHRCSMELGAHGVLGVSAWIQFWGIFFNLICFCD